MSSTNNNTDYDDTTVSVSMTMDNWTPIAAIVICCAIAACLIARCFTGDANSDTCYTFAIVLAVVLLVILIVVCYRRWSSSKASDGCEGFDDFEWGERGFEHASWKPDKRTHKIVGPDVNSTELRTWQYNPQNSLTDYRFYRTQEGAKPERIAPIARPRVGSYSGLANIDIDDRRGPISTRNPDRNSFTNKYVQQHPATPMPFKNAPVPYNDA